MPSKKIEFAKVLARLPVQKRREMIEAEMRKRGLLPPKGATLH